MGEVLIILSSLWVALVLTYLMGYVLRIFAGYLRPGEIDGRQMTQLQYLGIVVLMVVPIAMLSLSPTLSNPVNRWANIILAVVLFGFNLVGLHTCPSEGSPSRVIDGI